MPCNQVPVSGRENTAVKMASRYGRHKAQQLLPRDHFAQGQLLGIVVQGGEFCSVIRKRYEGLVSAQDPGQQLASLDIDAENLIGASGDDDLAISRQNGVHTVAKTKGVCYRHALAEIEAG